MSNEPTNASNDVSRNEMKKEYISDEEMKEIIKVWADGKWIYIAATDPEFSDKDIDENTSSSTDSGGRKKSKRIKTNEVIMKKMSDLVNFPNVTIGAKKQTQKVKQIREARKNRKANKNIQSRDDMRN